MVLYIFNVNLIYVRQLLFLYLKRLIYNIYEYCYFQNHKRLRFNIFPHSWFEIFWVFFFIYVYVVSLTMNHIMCGDGGRKWLQYTSTFTFRRLYPLHECTECIDLSDKAVFIKWNYNLVLPLFPFSFIQCVPLKNAKKHVLLIKSEVLISFLNSSSQGWFLPFREVHT